MPTFKYTATDASGAEKSGVIEAVNRPAAMLRLREMGYSSVSVTAQTGVPRGAAVPVQVPRASQAAAARKIALPSFFRRGLSRKQLMVFTRQLATMIDAGVALLRALQIIQKQEKDTPLKRITADLCESVEGGSTFAESLAQHPKVFDKLYINMVKAGEIGGVLQITLVRLAEFIEKAEKIKTKVKGAMMYPLVVMIMAIGILIVLMVKIVPKFTEIFADLLGSGQKMPALTQFVMDVSSFMVSRLPVIVGSIVGIVILFKLIGRTQAGRYVFDYISLKMPVFGALVLRVGISRFTRTLGTLQNSGVQILSALTIVRETAGNEVISRAIQTVHDSIKGGESVAAPLEQAGIFPTMVVSMIAVGEETGRLPEMLIKIADTYDTEVDAAVDGLTSIIEPLLIIFLAVIVGTIVIAMFMPLITIMSTLGKQA